MERMDDESSRNSLIKSTGTHSEHVKGMDEESSHDSPIRSMDNHTEQETSLEPNGNVKIKDSGFVPEGSNLEERIEAIERDGREFPMC